MLLEAVISYFARMTGLQIKEAQEYEDLCKNSMEALRLRLRAEVETKENAGRLAFAAAADAALHYTLMGGQLPSAIKLGDVSVSTGEQDGTLSAQVLRQHALEAIADCLESGIHLKQVGGQ